LEFCKWRATQSQRSLRAKWNREAATSIIAAWNAAP
jgi:hypothetical protein